MSSPSYVCTISYGLYLSVLTLAFDFSSVDKIPRLLCYYLLWCPVFSLCLQGEALMVFSGCFPVYSGWDYRAMDFFSFFVFLSSGNTQYVSISIAL